MLSSSERLESTLYMNAFVYPSRVLSPIMLLLYTEMDCVHVTLDGYTDPEIVYDVHNVESRSNGVGGRLSSFVFRNYYDLYRCSFLKVTFFSVKSYFLLSTTNWPFRP